MSKAKTHKDAEWLIFDETYYKIFDSSGFFVPIQDVQDNDRGNRFAYTSAQYQIHDPKIR